MEDNVNSYSFTKVNVNFDSESKVKINIKSIISSYARDCCLAVMIFFLVIGCWFLSPSKWIGWAQKVVKRRLAMQAELSEEECNTIRVIVGNRPTSWIESTFRPMWLTHKYLAWMQLLACAWPRRWQPSPQLVGEHHIDAALSKGRGVILFAPNFAYSDLMTKAALAGGGYEVCQLSQESHGFADGWLCSQWLNPIYNKIEELFLKERLVFSGQQTKDVNRLIKDRLKDNRPLVVSMTPLGRRTSVLPFLHGKIRIATGALNFACELGAPVLPVFTIRKPNGQIQTIVGHALNTPLDVSRSETIDHMLADYIPRLEAQVSDNPDQFAFPTSSQRGRAIIEPLSL